MAITIIKKPEDVELSRQNFHCHVRSDVYAVTPGAYGEVIYSGLENAVDGDNLTIIWPGTSEGVSITFADTPTDATQVKVKDVLISIAKWIDEELLPVLRSNPYLQDFECDREDDFLRITALIIGSDYMPDVTSSASINLEYSTDGANEVLRDLQIRMRVHYCDIDGDFIISPWQVFDVERVQTDDVYGEVKADLNGVIDGLMEHVFPVSTFSTPRTISHNRAFIEIAEHYATDALPDPWKRAGVRTPLLPVLKGATRLQDMTADSFYDYYVSDDRFLSNVLVPRSVFIDLPDYLNYFHKDPKEDRTIVAKVFYTDGTDDEQILDEYMEEDMCVRMIPCGFMQAGLDSLQPTKTPYKYTIRIPTVGLGPSAKPVTFNILNNDDTRSCIHYLNAYGLMETLHCEGAQEFETKPTAKMMDVVRPEVMSRSALTERSYDREQSSEVILQSVPMDTEAYQGYLDILISPYVFLQRPGTFARVAMQIERESVKFVPVARESRIGRMQLKLSTNKETGNSALNRWMV